MGLSKLGGEVEGSGELLNLVEEQTVARRGGSSPGQVRAWKKPEQNLDRAELLRYQQGQSLQAKLRGKARLFSKWPEAY